MNDTSDQEIPTTGIRTKKQAAFIDLIERYLVDNDLYNYQAVTDGLYPALDALAKQRPILQVIRSMKADLSCFQLNWIFNTISDYAERGDEIRKVWAQYQKSSEPKKKPSRKNRATEFADD